MRMFIWCVLMFMLGCDQDSPKDEYNDFRKRTAGARQDSCGASIKEHAHRYLRPLGSACPFEWRDLSWPAYSSLCCFR